MAFLRRHLGLIFRATITSLFVVWLLRNTDWSHVWGVAQGMELSWVVMGFASFLPVLIITAWRWRLLLGVHKLDISYWRSFELGMVGQFFNGFLIGTTGGDVVKIYYVTRLWPKARSAAAFTVIQDRVIGLVALLVLGSVLSLTNFQLVQQFFSTNFTALFSAVFYAIAFAGISGSLAACFGPWFLSMPRVQFLLTKVPGYTRLQRAIAAYERAARAWQVNIIAVLVSLLSHFGTLGMGYCLIRALHLTPPFFSFVAVVAIVNMLIAIPATIAGLGFREALFVSYLSFFAIDPATAKAFSFSFFLLNLAWSGCGGLFYLLYRHETHAPPPNDDDSSGALLVDPDPAKARE